MAGEKGRLKRSRIWVAAVCLIAVAVLAYATYGLWNMGREEPQYRVSVIVDDSGSDRWIAFREGLDQGAEDYPVTLDIVTTSRFESVEDEQAIIERELAGGADGVIVQMYASYDLSDYLAELGLPAAVVLVENRVEEPGNCSCVLTDDAGMGAALAQAVLADGTPASGEIRVGIVAGNLSQISQEMRLEGFEEAAAGTDIRILWTITGESDGAAYALEEYQAREPADVLVTLDNDATESASDYLTAQDRGDVRLCGVGSSEKNVYNLGRGVIRQLIVPQEFNMGYQSVALAAGRLQSRRTDTVTVGFLTVNRENMYDADNQKILFPIVQ